MTKEEFDKTRFNIEMKFFYRDEEYILAAVDFEERLIGLFPQKNEVNEYEICWVRCENVKIIEPNHPHGEFSVDTPQNIGNFNKTTMLRFIVFLIGIPLLVLAFVLTAILALFNIHILSPYIATFIDLWIEFVFSND